MDASDIQLWVQENPLLGIALTFLLSFVLFIIARGIIARGLVYIAKQTDTKYDDILVESLRPFRVAWLAPALVLYALAYLLPDYQPIIEQIALFLILWVIAITINSLVSAFNKIYESSPGYSGVSISGYLDLVKILVLLVAAILSVSLVTGKPPTVLLTGLGAMMAVLLLVFRDTILSIVASIQISVNDLIKQGDWIEVPSYGADGDVINMNLHTVKIQNWDKTISMIPTHKLVEVAYKNWRGMQESGGRRIKRSIPIDISSIRFCDQNMLDRYRRIDVLKEDLVPLVTTKNLHDETEAEGANFLSGGNPLTNMGVFRKYVAAYLRNHEAIHSEKMTFLVRELAPRPTGLPLEIYVFTKTTDWIEYELIQADIFDHLLAAATFFDLRVFQQPTGKDFAGLTGVANN